MKKIVFGLMVSLAGFSFVCSSGFSEIQKDENSSVITVSPPSLTQSQSSTDALGQMTSPNQEKEARQKEFIVQLGSKAQEFRTQLASSVLSSEAQEEQIAAYKAETANRISEFLNSEKAAEKTK